MKTLKIEVTQDDIDNGKASNPSYCPIALAINRTLKIDNALVGQYSASTTQTKKKWKIFPTKKFVSYLLSKRANAFVINFDAYGSGAVKPSTFTLTEDFVF